ncbi:MAG: hypothetical protein B7Z15_10655 [Rhizobiales bacterium 32-66-8]|nr:MAG: hypothetical protein B7Z15_10655 [Rhizobiales bacterium 32-66-8]
MLSRRAFLRSIALATAAAPVGVLAVTLEADAQTWVPPANRSPVPLRNAPPPPRWEARPPVRPGLVWVPGYWTWSARSLRYVWVEGSWQRSRPGMRYVGAQWVLRGSEWVFIPGRWVRW